MPNVEVAPRTPEQKGQEVLKLLKIQSKIQPHIFFEPDDLKQCKFFTSFPPELAESFPGSYIPPETFLKELGVAANKRKEDVKTILGIDASEYTQNALYSPESNNRNFSLTVWNGATNDYAVRMVQIAAQTPDFSQDAMARADYQDALVRTTFHTIKSKEPGNRGKALRIHDDCLASGDSIVGFLAATLEGADEAWAASIRKYGVEIIIDGPATAQGILFLNAFAKAHKIKLHIDAGYLAFGLSEGVKRNGKRKGANYITYPQELLSLMDRDISMQLINLKNKDDGNIYVVGDMGDAMQGISDDQMQEIRNQRGKTFCGWNDVRRDPHGLHKNAQKKLGSDEVSDNIVAEDIYFPNGGYLPAELDRLFGNQKNESKRVFIDAARMWLKTGYGAAFYDEGKKPKVRKTRK